MAQGSQGYGKAYQGQLDRWAAFDALPASLREALANAQHQWAPQSILKDWIALRKKRLDATEYMIDVIAKADDMKTREDTFRIWGRVPDTVQDLGL